MRKFLFAASFLLSSTIIYGTSNQLDELFHKADLNEVQRSWVLENYKEHFSRSQKPAELLFALKTVLDLPLSGDDQKKFVKDFRDDLSSNSIILGRITHAVRSIMQNNPQFPIIDFLQELRKEEKYMIADVLPSTLRLNINAVLTIVQILQFFPQDLDRLVKNVRETLPSLLEWQKCFGGDDAEMAMISALMCIPFLAPEDTELSQMSDWIFNHLKLLHHYKKKETKWRLTDYQFNYMWNFLSYMIDVYDLGMEKRDSVFSRMQNFILKELRGNYEEKYAPLLKCMGFILNTAESFSSDEEQDALIKLFSDDSTKMFFIGKTLSMLRNKINIASSGKIISLLGKIFDVFDFQKNPEAANKSMKKIYQYLQTITSIEELEVFANDFEKRNIISSLSSLNDPLSLSIAPSNFSGVYRIIRHSPQNNISVLVLDDFYYPVSTLQKVRSYQNLDEEDDDMDEDIQNCSHGLGIVSIVRQIAPEVQILHDIMHKNQNMDRFNDLLKNQRTLTINVSSQDDPHVSLKRSDDRSSFRSGVFEYKPNLQSKLGDDRYFFVKSAGNNGKSFAIYRINFYFMTYKVFTLLKLH